MNDLEYPVKPVVGQDVLIIPLNITGVIRNVIRYDSNGKWCCGVYIASLQITQVFNVYKDKDSNNWSAIDYVPTRYPDEDGVLKRM